MGLDGVELVMKVEESFGVTISDAEAVECERPADIIALVLGKLHTIEETGCVSQRGFYVLRRALTEILGIERRSVTLDLEIRSLVSEKSERALWESLKVATKARSWPSLVRPRWLVVSLWVLTGVVLLGLFRVTDPVIASAVVRGCCSPNDSKTEFHGCIPGFAIWCLLRSPLRKFRGPPMTFRGR